MIKVFADSYYFFALLNGRESAHQRALTYATQFHGEIVLTAWIIAELGDGLARPPWRQTFVELYDQLIASSNVRIIAANDDLAAAAIELYSARPDKSWTLTDCASFVVMDREGIREALTGDRHFEQAGFIALLK